MLTHYAVNAPLHHRLARAVCGRIISMQKEFSTSPTCPRCAAAVAEEDAIAARLMAEEQAREEAKIR